MKAKPIIAGVLLGLVMGLAAISASPAAESARGGQGEQSIGARAVVPPPAWLSPSDGLHPPGPDELDVRWLGVAGFEIRTAKAAILIDPYFSRPSLMELLTRPVTPNLERIHQYLRPVDAVFVGHAHFDHLMDAPEIARELKIPLYVSDQGERIANAEGLPKALQQPLSAGLVTHVGDLEIEAVESKHSDMPTQWLAGGDNPPRAHWPMGFLEYHNGPVYGFFIRWRGRSIYHSGSAQVVDAAIAGRHADLALLCLTGWTSSPTYFRRAGSDLTPRVVVPMHDDDFFQPLARGFVENPLAKRQAGFAQLRRDMPGASLVTVDFLQTLRLHAATPSP